MHIGLGCIPYAANVYTKGVSYKQEPDLHKEGNEATLCENLNSFNLIKKAVSN